MDKKLSGLRGDVPNSGLFTSLHFRAVLQLVACVALSKTAHCHFALKGSGNISEKVQRSISE